MIVQKSLHETSFLLWTLFIEIGQEIDKKLMESVNVTILHVKNVSFRKFLKIQI